MHSELSEPTLCSEFNLGQKKHPELQARGVCLLGTKSYLLKYKLRSEYSF
jgi:hypothetical protein